jgi:hypothetical protein
LTTASQAGNRTYTIPDAGTAASFVMTEGTQTVNGAKTFGSALTISDNTGSTSTTTGALKVTGGAGIGENLFVAGTLNATGNTSLGGTLAVTGNSTFNGNTTLGDASGDAVTINAATVTAANLQSDGTAAHRVVVSDAGTLRTASLATMVSGTVWLLDGNTTGGTKTIGSNDANDLGLETNGTTRLTITSGGASTFSGSLTSTGAFTANGAATLGDGNDNVAINAGAGTYSIASSALNVSTAGAISGVTTQSMSDALTITKTTNQIALSSAGAGVATLTTATLAGNRTYTIPEAGADASFVMTGGAQTVGGAKTFSASTVVEGDLTLGAGTSSDGGSIILNDDATGSSFTATVKSANLAASRTYTIPDAGATASFVMTEGTNTINGATNFNATAAFASALRFPFNRNTAGAVTIGANDFVVIQNAAAGITLPAGSAGRMLIVKNTSGATQTITANAGETCDAANLADGASITIIFNGGNWYQVGN